MTEAGILLAGIIIGYFMHWFNMRTVNSYQRKLLNRAFVFLNNLPPHVTSVPIPEYVEDNMGME